MAFIEKSYDLDNMSLSITVGGEGGQELEYDLSSLSEEIKQNLLCHGASQKIGDAAASVKKRLTDSLGRDPSEDELKAGVVEAMNAVWAQLASGEWRAARGEGEAKPRVGEVAQAIARLRGMDVEEVAKLVAATDKEKVKAWRAHPQIQAEIAKIRAERAATKLAKLAESGSFDPFA
jgi:hypothetical protein